MPRCGAPHEPSRIFDALSHGIRFATPKASDRPSENKPIVHMPCGECGLQVGYVRGNMSPLLKHMSIAHPGREVLHFGSSEVEEDEVKVGEVEPASREDCTARTQIKDKLLFQLGQRSSSEVIEREKDSDHAHEGGSSDIGRMKLKINLAVNKRDRPKRSRGRFTRTMKNDDELYRSEKTRGKSKLLSRELPMALQHLQQSGIDIGSIEELNQTMVFHPAGKMYSNFRKFTCPKCACSLAPVLTAIKEGRTLDACWINNQCFLTTCWPLMLLPIFYAEPFVSFHMRCVQCGHYLGKLDRNGSVVAEVVVDKPNDASTTSDAQESVEELGKTSGGTGDKQRRGRSQLRSRRRRK